MHIAPYLFFNGRCEEAIDFYKSAVGAEVGMLMRFADAPSCDGGPQMPPGSETKIMHASLKIGTTELMVSDGMCTDQQSNFQGFSLSLSIADAATADRIFAALAEGGEVRQPLTETFFSPRFGMAVDRFGVGWMVVVPAHEARETPVGEGRASIAA